MSDLGDLTRTYFKGFFRRNPEAAAKELKALRTNPSFFLAEEATAIERDQGTFDFNLWVLHYDPFSGLFIARAEDAAGNSGIVGAIQNGKIEFLKVYKQPHEISSREDMNFVADFRRIRYYGMIGKPDKIITAGGDYLIEDYNESMGGSWRMDSVPK